MTLEVDPHGLLEHVHPDLAKVMVAAAGRSTIPFRVIQGLRSEADEAKAVATGHSTTMHSRHLADANYGGRACAVDVAAFPRGILDWSPLNYQPIAAAVLEVAHEQKVPITWGGAWHTFKDYGHFELPWKEYP